MYARSDGRQSNEARTLTIRPGFIGNTPGSVLVELGNTRVICTATVEEVVPVFLRDTGRGWVTAEYGMLPGSGDTRIPREASRGRVGGRTHEIQRLIGRSLRGVTDLTLLGPRTIWVDCDVIEADGGTRTASITGGYVALALALQRLRVENRIEAEPLTNLVAAISVGVVEGEPLVDLCYEEDSRAEVDMNIVMTGDGDYVEIQGTAEGKPFTRSQLNQLVEAGAAAIAKFVEVQLAALGK